MLSPRFSTSSSSSTEPASVPVPEAESTSMFSLLKGKLIARFTSKKAEDSETAQPMFIESSDAATEADPAGDGRELRKITRKVNVLQPIRVQKNDDVAWW
jgi:hypothetical protein